MTNQPLPTIPPRIAKLKVDSRGFPVPWFVQWFKDGEPGLYGEGVPDFRVMDSRKWMKAVKNGLCWVCGEHIGRYKAFVIGPMCAVNRVTSEPHCHRECAIFSVQACPFLSRPRMRRNLKDLPEQAVDAAGFAIDRNPGVACIWTTQSFRVFRPSQGGDGWLISLGMPDSVLWFANGKTATREEVLASIDSGFPLLEKLALEEGAEAMAELVKQRERTNVYLPAA